MLTSLVRFCVKEAPLVVFLEERIERGSAVTERRVVDVACRPDVALEKATHRIVFVCGCAALRVTQMRWIPSAAGMHEDPIRARVRRARNRLCASAKRVCRGGQNTCEACSASDT